VTEVEGSFEQVVLSDYVTRRNYTWNFRSEGFLGHVRRLKKSYQIILRIKIWRIGQRPKVNFKVIFVKKWWSLRYGFAFRTDGHQTEVPQLAVYSGQCAFFFLLLSFSPYPRQPLGFRSWLLERAEDILLKCFDFMW
jgi:hypothetical protein